MPREVRSKIAGFCPFCPDRFGSGMYALGSGALFWRTFGAHFVSDLAQHRARKYVFYLSLCAHLVGECLERISHESFLSLLCALWAMVGSDLAASSPLLSRLGSDVGYLGDRKCTHHDQTWNHFLTQNCPHRDWTSPRICHAPLLGLPSLWASSLSFSPLSTQSISAYKQPVKHVYAGLFYLFRRSERSRVDSMR